MKWRGLLTGILRAHRQVLSRDQRKLGDKYVIAEFRQYLKFGGEERMKETFLRGWEQYLEALTRQKGENVFRGRDLTLEEREGMSREQLQRLGKLKRVSDGVEGE